MKRTRRTRKDMTASCQINRKMDDATFKLRRKVIEIVFEAKALLAGRNVDMDRVDVRITDSRSASTLGVARRNDKIIWIPATTITDLKPLELRHTVLHELCHALFGTKHDKNCDLMGPVLRKTTRKQQDNAFLTQALLR